MLPRLTLPILPILACLACAEGPQFPDTGITEDPDAPFPTLIPLNTLLAGAPTTQQITPGSMASLQARITSLRARAARLAGPVVDPVTRTRMTRAIERAALR